VYLLVFHVYFYWFFIFKGLTARRLFKSFGVKDLMKVVANKQKHSFLVMWDNYGLVTLVIEDILRILRLSSSIFLNGLRNLIAINNELLLPKIF
jgi:hypothetical protein